MPAGPRTRLPLLARLAVLGLVSLSPGRPGLAYDGQAAGVLPLARVFQGTPRRVTFRAPVVYLALDSGLETLDASDPARPLPLCHAYLPGSAHDVDVSGSHAYVADGEGGLQVVDVSDPYDLVVVGSAQTGDARAVAVAGGIAYVADAGPGTAGLHAIDVSDPRAPFPLGFLPLPEGALEVAVAGTRAYVGLGLAFSSGSHGLLAVDVSDPRAPAAVPGGRLATGKPVHEIALEGGLAYLACGIGSNGALLVADIGAAAPQLIAAVPLRETALGVAVLGPTAWIAARSLGLLAFDVTDPRSPWQLDALATGRDTTALAVLPGFALLGERSSIAEASFTSVDTIALGAAREVASFPFAEAMAVASSPGRAYLLRRGSLDVFDERTGTLSWIGGFAPPRADFTAISVEGTLAALAEGSAVRLLDLTDPTRPIEVGRVPIDDGIAVRVVLAAPLLHVVTGGALETWDVTSAVSPVRRSVFGVSGWASGLSVTGTTGYLAAGDTLHVLDLAVAGAPLEMGRLTLAGERLHGVGSGGGGLVLATGYDNALYAIDAADPSAPALLGILAGIGGQDVVLAGDRAVVAAGARGVLVVDLRDPADPRLEGFLDTSGTASSVSVEGDTIYAATAAGQHWMLRCTTCTSSGCLPSWPAIAANSLRLSRAPIDQTLVWSSSGSGSANVHRTLDKRALPGLASDLTSVVGTSALGAFSALFDPPVATPALYRVLGRDSCDGSSHEP